MVLATIICLGNTQKKQDATGRTRSTGLLSF